MKTKVHIVPIGDDSTKPVDWNNELADWLTGRELRIVKIVLDEAKGPQHTTKRRWLITEEF